MSLETINNTVGKFLGRLVGGLMIEMTGFAGVYGLLTVCTWWRWPHPTSADQPAGPTGTAQPIWQSLVSGFGIPAQRVVLGVLCITVIMNALAFSYRANTASHSQGPLTGWARLMGLLASADGLGTLIGALLSRPWETPLMDDIFALGALLE